jgi:hypothetical protein
LICLVPSLNPTQGSLLAAPATEKCGNLFLETGIPHFSVAGAANKDFKEFGLARFEKSFLARKYSIDLAHLFTLNQTYPGPLLAAPATEKCGNLFLEIGIPHFSVAGAANKKIFTFEKVGTTQLIYNFRNN